MFWDIIDKAADIIAIVTFLFAIYVLVRNRRDIQRYLRARAAPSTDRPRAIAIGLPNDIRGAVEDYLRRCKLDMPVESATYPWVKSEDEFYRVLNQIAAIKSKLTHEAVTEVHLFYKGPVTLAAAIGVLFDNWVPVSVYEYQGDRYQRIAVLEKGIVKGMFAQEIADKVLDTLSGKGDLE